MFPPFPQFLARHYIQLLIDDIDCGKVCLNQLTPESVERQGSGVMLGSLVCYDKQTFQRVILYAVSGISKQLTFCSKNLFRRTVNNERQIIVLPIADDKEINRALSKNDLKIHQLTEQITLLKKEKKSEIKQLQQERTNLTTESLRFVFNLYNFEKFDGRKISLSEIISSKGKLPPTGTGDCCAPKLLNYAFKNDLQPLSMDEIFYGKGSKNKKNGISYFPCDSRCGYILPEILGLEILYRDSQIIVINKPSGLLSVPGRGPEKSDCAEARVKKLFPQTINQPAVHRLDMETSGILILAFTKESHRNLNMQFAEGKVHKKYVAILDGILEKATGLLAPKNGQKSGEMSLPFRLDVENRPLQIYDEQNGKIGITQWENLGTVFYNGKKCTKILFTPKTGRTHQLRLASADYHGFGLPIIGDSLYGKKEENQRLLLHCCQIEFKHPVSGELMHIECESDF